MIRLVKMARDLPDDYERRAICRYTISTITNSGLNDSYLTEIVESFTKVKEDLDTVINRKSASPYTEDINESHRDRLENIKRIYRGLSFFSTHYDAGKVKSAQTISEIYNHCFRDLPDRKYATYTQVIDTFLLQAKTPSVIPAFEDLGMMELVDLLDNSQTKFLSSRTKRAQEKTPESFLLAKEVRNNMHNIFDILDRHLYFRQYQGYEGYEELTQRLNGSICEILTGAKYRKTHGNNETAAEIVSDDESPMTDVYEKLDDPHDEMNAGDQPFGRITVTDTPNTISFTSALKYAPG